MTTIDLATQQLIDQNRGAMRLREASALDGPNAWIDRPAIRLLLDAGNPTGEALERLRQLLAGESLAPASGRPDADGAPTHVPSNVGALLADIIMELQQLAGDGVSFSTSSPLDRANQFDIVCECYESDLALTAAGIAVHFLSHLVYRTEPKFDLNREFNRHVMWHIRYRETQQELLAAKQTAERLGIPVRITDKRQRLVEFGLSAYNERMLGSMTSKSIEISSRLARNKPLTKAILRENGIPVPLGSTIRTIDEANRFVDEFGFPVVVKPTDRRQGIAVTVDIRSKEELATAVESAIAASKSGVALVERMVEGNDFRILIINDQVIRVLERVPAHVVGDGQQTIAELIAIVNQDPLRQPGSPSGLFQIVIDADTHTALERQELTVDSVPEPGKVVRVKLAANYHHGATGISHKYDIHPDNVQLARSAARAIGLALCGLDFITPDISRSVWEVGGAVIEANSEPSYSAVVGDPDYQGEDIGSAIINMFYPPGQPYQPTIVTLPPGHGQHALAQVILKFMRRTGMTVGLATQSRTEFEGPDFNLRRPADRSEIDQVARNPYVTGAIFEIGQQDIERRGLPFLQSDVAILGSTESEPPAPAARQVDRVLAGLVSPGGAVIFRPEELDIAEPLMDADRRWMLASTDPDHAAVSRHLQSGGSVVTITGGSIVHRTSQREVPILPLSGVRADLAMGDVLKGVAAGLAMHVPNEEMSEALREGREDR